MANSVSPVCGIAVWQLSGTGRITASRIHTFGPSRWYDTASIDQSPVISAKLEKPIMNKIGRTMRAGRVELVAAIEGIILLVAALFRLTLRDDEESRFFGLQRQAVSDSEGFCGRFCGCTCAPPLNGDFWGALET